METEALRNVRLALECEVSDCRAWASDLCDMTASASTTPILYMIILQVAAPAWLF